MRKLPMMIAAAGALVALSGCGSTDTTRTATGGAGGAVAGAVVGGPVGAVVGGVGGAAAGATMDEGLEKKAQDLTSNDTSSSSSTSGRSSRHMASRGSEYRSPLSAERVRTIQQALNDRTDGRDITVDGVWGPNTRRALRQFQRDNNLRATGQLNAETLSALNLSDRTGTGGQDAGGRTTGGTTPTGQSGASGTGNAGTGTAGQPGNTGTTGGQQQ